MDNRAADITLDELLVDLQHRLDVAQQTVGVLNRHKAELVAVKAERDKAIKERDNWRDIASKSGPPF